MILLLASALDPDLMISCRSFAREGDNDNDNFVIVDNQLILDSPAALADQTQYSVRLRVTDEAGSFHDERLVFSLPVSILSSTTGFDESLPVGSVVADLSITGYSDSTDVNFKLIDQSHDLFSTSGNQLILAREVDYENISSHRVTVRLLDSGEVAKRACLDVLIKMILQTILKSPPHWSKKMLFVVLLLPVSQALTKMLETF